MSFPDSLSNLRGLSLGRARGGMGVTRSALLDNLFAYYALEEASGERTDATGRGNNLTDNNTVTQAVGRVGQAASFASASSESLSRADNADLSSGDIDFTLAVWVFLASKTLPRAVICKGDNVLNNNGVEYEILYNSVTDRFRFLIGSGTSSALVNADNLGIPATDTWYLIVAWHDAIANTINIQVNDGTVDSAADVAGQNTTDPFYIGRTELGLYMNGRIDEAGLWKRVLTAAERTALYNGGNGVTYPFSGT